MVHKKSFLSEALENPKKIQNYSCGNGLDYLARKRDGLDSQTAMLWVFFSFFWTTSLLH